MKTLPESVSISELTLEREFNLHHVGIPFSLQKKKVGIPFFLIYDYEDSKNITAACYSNYPQNGKWKHFFFAQTAVSGSGYSLAVPSFKKSATRIEITLSKWRKILFDSEQIQISKLWIEIPKTSQRSKNEPVRMLDVMTLRYSGVRSINVHPNFSFSIMLGFGFLFFWVESKKLIYCYINGN